ncbi:hypothetical protein [Simiduia agarivorans]|uniref:DUF3995 domain-containing protein n=1 Tax=Simiduia agarivorans (strain DSM 21679 / JCM 13881 / BCRC 17597 / SA1) TaxID=1117647 RepID=K4KQG1_SIMAS|nr:hypothetical protein [Simiduia agarivorans]AFV00506.1 hypothetical protein M5M_16875 [Simiduia agarivorans SA1 = DSM 21679]
MSSEASSDQNGYLLFGAGACFIAAFVHLLIIFGGPDWYRFFGAGESMAQMAEQGDWYPVIVTLGIALLLCVWGCYALSGAGKLFRLPLLRTALVIIAAIFCARGSVGLLLPWISQHPQVQGMSVAFWLVSSGICLCIGSLYAAGLWRHIQLRSR